MNNVLLQKYMFAVLAMLGILLFYPVHAFASTNISSSSGQYWAWNDVVGWIDFYTPNTANVTISQLTGYASSSAGYISFDCATSPAGNICAKSNYKVSNDGAGNLSGWAWNDTYGWISFCGNSSGGASTLSSSTWVCPVSPTYQVYMDSVASGTFLYGWAWNDAIGWIDFNCGNPQDNICATSNFYVETSWDLVQATATLDSATFDTGVASGAQINSAMFEGSEPAQTAVGISFALSNSSSGPWNFPGYWYPFSGPGIPTQIFLYASSTGRYFRYRITLESNPAETLSPVINDVIVNWSP